MSARKTPLSKRLAELEAAVVAAKQRVRECDLAERRAAGEVTRLQDALVDAYADGDDARAAKASRERDKAEATLLRDAQARHEGAKRALQRAEVERSTFAAEKVAGLIAERQPAADHAAERVERAVMALVEARDAWVAVNNDVAALLRSAGRDTRDLPGFPVDLDRLVKHAKQHAGVDVPLPLPGAFSVRTARREQPARVQESTRKPVQVAGEAFVAGNAEAA